MGRKPKKKRPVRKPSTLALLVVGCLLLIVCWQIISVYRNLSDAKVQEASLSDQLFRQQQENDALRSDLEHASDTNFWKKLARKNDLYEDGTRIFIDVND